MERRYTIPAPVPSEAWDIPAAFASRAARAQAQERDRRLRAIMHAAGLTTAEARKRIVIEHDRRAGLARIRLDGSPVGAWRE